MNYKVLVNKKNLIREHEINTKTFVIVKAFDYEDVLIDRTVWLSFLKLKQKLLKQEIKIDIDSAYRSISRQEKLYEKFALKKGEEYATKFVAPIGSSEHHTGLAIDVELINNTEDDEDAWVQLHKYLPEFGFILRYPKEKEEITGYSYEPWHIRYVGKKLAIHLTKQNLTLEEYYKIKER